MALDKRDTIPIPGPRALPIIGNALDVQGDVPIERIAALGGRYGTWHIPVCMLSRIDRCIGEIFSLWLGGRRTNFVSSHALLNEICDEKRFVKKVSGGLAQVRNGVHDGLFVSIPLLPTRSLLMLNTGVDGTPWRGELGNRTSSFGPSLWTFANPWDVQRHERYCCPACHEVGSIWGILQSSRN